MDGFRLMGVYSFDHRRWLPQDLGGWQNPANTLPTAVFSPFGTGSRVCIGLHLARMEMRLGVCEFFRKIPHARLALSTSDESMEMENFFLIAPRSHKCEILT